MNRIKSKNNKSHARQKEAVRPANVLVVADAGSNADYRSEPRHVISVPLDFIPRRRSSIRRLESLVARIRWQLPTELHDNAFHAWLLDAEGQPSLFLTGLLAVRKQEKSRDEAESLNDRLVPQVTSEQQDHKWQLLASASVEAWSYDYDEEECEGNESEIESEVLDFAFGRFDEYNPVDSDFEDCVYVAANVWQKVELVLPFDLTSKLTPSQLWHIHSKVSEQITEMIDGDYMPEVDNVELWAMVSGLPSLYLTGLLRMLEGRLSRRKLKDLTELLRRFIPESMLAAGQAA